MSVDTTVDQVQAGTQPAKEHQWLQQLAGEWTFEGEVSMGPDEPPMKFTGTECVRSLGGLWVVLEGRSKMGDGEGTTIMSLGYDLTPMKYVGTWIGSMMSRLWVYDITMAPSGDALWLESDGPDMADPDKLARYRDIITIISPDHRTLTGNIKGAGGEWTEFMITHYHRVK